MTSRKYASGASKRKGLKERDKFESKLPKLTSFFTIDSENIKSGSSSNVIESEINPGPSCSRENCSGVTTDTEVKENFQRKESSYAFSSAFSKC